VRKGVAALDFFLLLWPSHKSPELLHRYLCATCIASLSLHRRKIRRKKEDDSIHQGYSFADQTQKGKRPRKSAGAAERNLKFPGCVCVSVYILHTQLYRATHKRKEKRDEKKKKKWMRHQERS
jgi:hypothetical protein